MKPFVSIFCLLLAGCATMPVLDQRGPSRAALRGMVYDLDRLPVSGALVRLGGTGPSRETLTDIHGRFLLDDVASGNLTIFVEKKDYEPFQWSFAFSEASQVVYVQLANADQLYEAAVASLESKDWERATKLLDRAEHIQAPGATAVYLRAVLLGGAGRDSDAAQLLETFLATHPPVLAMLLRLGDLYRLKLDRPDAALAQYRRSLEIKYDAEVEAIVRELEKPRTP